VVVDAKINYPAACNAMETLLIHRAHIESGAADRLLRELRRAGVSVLGGPKAIEEGLISQAHAAVPLDPKESADPLHVEYGDLICACEIVEGLDEAIAHCNEHGSGHTEAIISEDEARIERFLREVDSACVFANASTRFADGFRLGLGAEVGISTSRIHARGPVGIEGLLTSKWLLRSTRSSGHTVGEFSSEGGPQYTHRPLP
jgi:delta-1-pyrroline-5-carboxylate synthetase